MMSRMAFWILSHGIKEIIDSNYYCEGNMYNITINPAYADGLVSSGSNNTSAGRLETKLG